MSVELATAYVQIVPSLNGVEDTIAKAIGGSSKTDAAGVSLGTRLAKAVSRAFSNAVGLGKSIRESAKAAGETLQIISLYAKDAVRETLAALAPLGAVIGKVAHGIAAPFVWAWDKVTGAASRAVAAVASAVASVVSKVASAVSGVLSNSWQHIVGWASSVGSAVASAGSRISSAIVSGLSQAGQKVGGWASSLGAAAANAASSAASRVASAIASGLSQAGQKIDAWAPGLRARIGAALEPARAATMRFAAGLSIAAEGALQSLSARLPAVGSAIATVMGRVGTTITSTMGRAGTYISGAVQRIGAAWAPVGGVIGETLQSALSKAVSGAGKVVSGIGSVISSAGSAAVSAAQRIGSAVGGALADSISFGVKSAGAALAGLSVVIGANLGGAVQRADQLNNFPKVMANIGFSADEANEQIRRIASSLDGLPTSTDAVVMTAKGLAPLTGSLTQATDISLALNNALLAGGGDATLAANAMEQYRQMLSNGTVDMQAWRSMTTAMPGQMDMIAKSLLGATANSSELYTALKKGTISFDQFNAALVDLNTNGREGFASFEEQARTATAGIGTAFTNAGNRVKKALASIIEAIGVDAISEKINQATSGITGFGEKIAAAITSLKETGGFESISHTLGGLLPIIGGLAGALGPLLTQVPLIGGAFSGLTGPVGIVIGLFASMLTHSETLRTAIGGVFEQLSAALQTSAVTGALQSLGTTLSVVASILGDALGNALNLVAPILANLATAIIPVLASTFGQLMEAAAPIVAIIFQALAEVIAALLPPLSQIAGAILPALAQMFSMVMAAAAPLIQQLAGILVQALNLIMPILTQLISAIMPVIVEVIGQILPPLQQVIAAIMNVVSALLPPLVTIIGAVISALTPIIATVLPVLGQLISVVIGHIASWITTMSTLLVPVINVVASVINVAVSAIGAVWLWLWNNVIGPVIGWITDKIQGWSDFLTGTVKPVIDQIVSGIGDSFTSMKDSISDAFNKVKSAAAKPINFVINTVYTNGIKWLVDKVMEKLGLELRMPAINPIAEYATGGVLPGYTPGRDVYRFFSPDGGGALALSGGESIMRPEWTRAVGGRRAVDAMNDAARHGRPIPGGDAGFQRFADGGIWGKLKSGAKSAWDWVSDKAEKAADIIADPIGAIENLVKVPVDALINSYAGNGGAFWEAGKAIPGKIIAGVSDWVKEKSSTLSASDLVSQARLAIGTPYVWGGVNVPGGVDCSGLIVWALRQMGHNVPRHTASSFQAASTPGNPNVPGTLLFWGGSVGSGGAHHVAVASGNGMMVEAPTFGIPVREIPIYGGPSAGVFRYDDGGLLQPGMNVVENKTGVPEPVFTSGQWSKIDELLTRSNPGPQVLEVRDVDGILIGRMQVESSRAVDRVASDLSGRRVR